MINFENITVVGFEPAIRGMRNSWNSWSKSDSIPGEIGPNDLELMQKLARLGTDHRKYLRMIEVYVDITAPLYWWKEFDTYKIGTVANSCSTMHRITEKEFTESDFSIENLSGNARENFKRTIADLNSYRMAYLNATNSEDKTQAWRDIIQTLPSSYNQRRTVLLNYEVLANILGSRRNHKLLEWREMCSYFIPSLPHFELIAIAAR